MNEFELIEHFFKHTQKKHTPILLGIGDDAALINPPQAQALAMTMDTLVAGVHFPVNTPAYDIGYKAVAVNLSDLAAMGAVPQWLMLALTLPAADTIWLENFCRGFFALFAQYDLELIGGDTTHGPLTITVHAQGLVSPHDVLRRDTAKVDDLIFVTGTLGNAGLALELLQSAMGCQDAYLLGCLNRPVPRVEAGLAVKGSVKCAIDISDGLVADLGHILRASKVGAQIYVDDLPLSNSMLQFRSQSEAWPLALTAGDDYELCFTAAPELESHLYQCLAAINCPCTCIGVVQAQPGLRISDHSGRTYKFGQGGYQHF